LAIPNVIVGHSLARFVLTASQADVTNGRSADRETTVEIQSNRDASSGSHGGRPARILVADDNSNIQRMVALALKDHGIEVAAVGNGEAAVRAIAQSKPDLILADVFMPVRSGYEVCSFVKTDSRYSHIPVILLLGAFDPFDENEAKRVGADGVLKKPFVPPDPMIALVKALLEKTAHERIEPEPVAVAVAPEPRAIPEQPAPRPARAVVEAPAEAEESSEIDYPPMGRDAFPDNAPAVAHSAAHGSATTDIEDDEVLTSSRDAALGEPAFWHPTPSDGSAGEESEEAAHVEEPAHASIVGPAEAVVEEISESAHSDAPGDPFAVSTPAQRPESAAITKPRASEDPAPKWSETANDWETSAPPSATSDRPMATSLEQAASEWATGPRTSAPALRSGDDSHFAPASAVWDEPVPAAAASEAAEAEAAHQHSWEKETPAEIIEEAEAGHATSDEVPQESTASVTDARAEGSASEAKVAEPPIAAVPGVEPPAAKATDEELVEAVIARVIEKLQPQIAQMINEEILRPVVSALVRHELENK
jgi:CheY-like chemotaxis protein